MNAIRTVARAIIEHEGAWLVIRYRTGPDAYYALPGGGGRHGETLHAAVTREVAEETGAVIRVGPLRFVRECIAGPDAFDLPPGYHAVELFFECELIIPPGACAEPDPGQCAVEWRTPGDLRSCRFFPPALLDAVAQGPDSGYLGPVWL